MVLQKRWSSVYKEVMKILLVNDDGINAKGINVLKSVLEKDNDITLFAPDSERSATGHGISLRRELTLNKVSDSIYSCCGLPADCVFLALNHFFKDDLPDIVISGINRGPNLGQDVYYSGTVAAAREASISFIPSIAISLAVDFWNGGPDEYFDYPANFVSGLIKNGVIDRIPKYSLLNINVPNLPEDKILEPVVTKLGFRKYAPEVKVEGNKAKIGGAYVGYKDTLDSDCKAVEDGHISISSLNFLRSDNNEDLEIFDII